MNQSFGHCFLVQFLSFTGIYIMVNEQFMEVLNHVQGRQKVKNIGGDSLYHKHNFPPHPQAGLKNTFVKNSWRPVSPHAPYKFQHP